MEKVVCDASSLISLSENCLLGLLPKLGAEFVVAGGVKKELVDKPLRVDEFQLKALRLRKAIGDGYVRAIDDRGAQVIAKQILKEANSLFSPQIRILHQGEAESLALLERLGANTLLVDERTTRLLVEDPAALAEHFQRRTEFNIELDEAKARALQQRFSDVNVIRSSELAAYAYEKGLFGELGDGVLLHACLYALKYSGCAITKKEIDEYLELLG